MNLEYIGNLSALKVWYLNVRLARTPKQPDHEHLRIVTRAASEVLSGCIDERVERLRTYLEERHMPVPRLSVDTPLCPLNVETSGVYVDHVKWVSTLSDADVELGVSWLKSIVEKICDDGKLMPKEADRSELAQTTVGHP